MMSKVIYISWIIGSIITISNAASVSQSNRYPAGIHPSLCPHYPYCDNLVLAGFAQQSAGLPLSLYGSVPVAQGYPAGLDPHSCPNYPYCSHQIPPEAIHYRRFHQDYYTGSPTSLAASYISPNGHRALASTINAQYTYPLEIINPNGFSRSANMGGNKYPAGVDPASCPNYPYCH